ncbi:MAG: pilus assembly protein [Desulfobacterales bacterium]|jgi:hypothetical protein
MKRKILIEDQNGATVVEFAIILPLLIVFLFGIIEFGLLLYNKQVITNASREGARAGLVVRDPRLSNQEIKDKVKEYAQSRLVTFGSDTLEDDDIDILPIDSGGGFDPNTERCTSFGCDLKVGLTYYYDFLFLSNFGLGPITLEEVSTMKME